MSEPAVLGVVLAGGRSSRMGCPKAQVTLGARPLVEHGLALFAAAGIDAAVVTKDLSLLPANTASKHRVLIEDESEIHPLFGVLTALKHANGRPVLALACDMPFVPAAFLRELA